MFKNITEIFKKFGKNKKENSKVAAKERLHLVLAQDRANISADFLEMMKQEIIEVIKKYIDIDEDAIDVKMTNKQNEDGTVGAPSLYANIPIITIKNEARKVDSNSVNENKEDLKEIKENDEKEVVEEKVEKIEEVTEEIENEELEEELNETENLEETEIVDEEEKEEIKEDEEDEKEIPEKKN